MQPLGRIRRYFGEMQALYFAWAGLLAYTLFMPTVIGIIMFIVTVTQRLLYLFQCEQHVLNSRLLYFVVLSDLHRLILLLKRIKLLIIDGL